MPAKFEKKTSEIAPEKEIYFTCKFCGEIKPLKDLVVMREYYPQISACKTCSLGQAKLEKCK